MANSPESFTEKPTVFKNPNQEGGCLPTALFIFYLIWLGLISLASLVGMWLIENLLFEGSLGLPDIRGWVGLGYLLAIGLPLAALVWLPGVFRGFYRAVGLSAAVGLLMLPARWLFLTEFQSAALIAIGSLSIGIWICLRLLSQHQTGDVPSESQKSFSISVIWFIVGLAWIPYALWGALGSPLDALLGVVVGALLGWFMALLLELFMAQYRSVHPSGENPRLALKIVLLVAIGLILANNLPLVGYQFSLTPPLILSAVGAAVISSLAEKAPSASRQMGIALFVGSAAILPLVFIDGDELMLVIGSSAGELIGYALRMMFVHSLALLIMGMIGIILLKSLRGAVISRWFFIPAGLVWVAGLTVYLTAGQPGFYGERLFVVFRQQATFDERTLPNNVVERRNFVYQALVRNAEFTQADVQRQLDRLRIDYRSYYLVNAMEVNGGPLVKIWLTNQREVERVLPSPRLRPLSQSLPPVKGSLQQLESDGNWNLEMVGAPKVWREFGVRGAGIVVGLADSGADWEHPQLHDQYRGKNGDHDYNWLDVWFGGRVPQDTSGHGTHTLGSILGKDVGVAPDAQWIGCVNLARNLGNPAVYLDCWQFLFAPYPQDGNPFRDGRPDLGAHILNNSWGCPQVEGCDPLVFLPAVRALKAAGVFVVVSAGNSGYSGCGSVDAPPAIYEEVLTVGAVNRNGDLAGFSSLGPVTVDGSQRLKAEILAPGEEIFSSYPNGTYERASGTSMAGPHVAGVVALMWSANPALVGKVDLTRQIIFDTAQTYQGVLPECVDANTRPAQGIGYGIMDAYRAVQRARQIQ